MYVWWAGANAVGMLVYLNQLRARATSKVRTLAVTPQHEGWSSAGPADGSHEVFGSQ